MSPVYAELHCLTNFTFLRGASHPQELVARAAALGYSALAITDECSLAGVVRAHEEAKQYGLKLIVGSEIAFFDGKSANKKVRIVLLAIDRAGYGHLSALITRGRRASKKGEYRLTLADLDVGLPDCLALFVPDADTNVEDARQIGERFPGRAWIAAELLFGADDATHLAHLQALSSASGLPLVAAGDVHMHVRARRALQDTLTAIRLGVPVKNAGDALHPNAERSLRPLARLARIYPAELLAETLTIAERCHFSLDELRYEYPEEIVPAGETATSYLRALAEDGFRRRFSGAARNAGAKLSELRRQVERELALIAELRYEPFFLTVHDIVNFARSQNILCQGRGSAANSIVCYCLGITEVDPVRMQMLFERFISKERNEPPDIDVDFEHERREEVIQYIYQKYTRERAALAAAVITYRPKSALRDVGKALGMNLDQVDRLAQSMAWWDGRKVIGERLREVGFDPDNRIVQRVMMLVNELVGFPRHLSQHTGGFVISRGPLAHLVPTENAAMPERTVIQWDKDDLESLGLLKVDVLALGMLTAIRKAIDLVNNYNSERPTPKSLPPFRMGVECLQRDSASCRTPPCRPRCPLHRATARRAESMLSETLVSPLTLPFKGGGNPSRTQSKGEEQHQFPASHLTLGNIPAEDAAVYDMICAADTIGVFQIESRAQMSMLPRLRPRDYYDLVIEVAIVRPGPIQGGMVHPYLRRRQKIDPVVYPSEAVKGVLGRTLGVPIFQEQVMQLAVVAAGFTPGEADQLRRSMAAWRRKGGLEPFELRLKQGMRERGYADEFAEQIFRQIQGFGEYGFPESHSASFALLVYASAWLKCHEPAAFCAALLNSQPMGFYAPAQIVQDARRHGVEVRPVDATASDWDCTLEPDDDNNAPAVRLGLRMVKGLSQAGAERLVLARAAQPFTFHISPFTLEDLARRAKLDQKDLRALAAANAFASLTGHRRDAAWRVAGIEAPLPVMQDAPIHERAPLLTAPTEAENIVADYASIGLTLGRHPLALLRERLTRMRIVTARTLKTLPHGRFARVAGIVTNRQHPATAKGTIFVTLEDETDSINVVVWKDLSDAQRNELLRSSLMGVAGVLEKEGEVVHLVARKLFDYSSLLGKLVTRSRDFH
jgi:error-prone DNA polymerase